MPLISLSANWVSVISIQPPSTNSTPAAAMSLGTKESEDLLDLRDDLQNAHDQTDQRDEADERCAQQDCRPQRFRRQREREAPTQDRPCETPRSIVLAARSSQLIEESKIVRRSKLR